MTGDKDVWPVGIVDVVRKTLNIPIRKPEKPEFVFDMSMEAAEKNYLLLMQKYGGSLEKALTANRESPLEMGSEFRPIEVLQ